MGPAVLEVHVCGSRMQGTISGDGYGLWIGGAGAGSVGGDSYALYVDTPF